ncbi:hypothetical protein ABIA00_000362 [Bradyrhizobium ottawaense]|uniref:Ulp1 family isopeptidase n=1 Tax=Bradyrhizobium ottawaense TaxID=931866 RepID=UPI003835F68A
MDGGFFPNAGAWNSWYHEQVAQQSENVPADQASVEEQPDGLQLSASDEAEGSPGQARGVRRVDVGAMRQMLQSDLQSGRFISGRHSVDFPGASIDHLAGVPQSGLRAAGFASVRYTAPSGNASAPKGRHSLLSRAGSRLKSALRSIGGGVRKKTSGPSNEQQIVWSQNNPSADLNREDAELIEWYKDQLIREGGPAERAKGYLSALRRLSLALAAKGQLPFSGRLDDPALDAEARAVNRNALTALNGLRKLKGVATRGGRHVHSADAELIEWYKDQFTREEPTKYASYWLRRLSRALAEKGQPPFAGRLEDPALDAEARAVHRNALAALNHLRKLKGFTQGSPLYSKDEDLIQRFQEAGTQRLGISEVTTSTYSSHLRALSRWCFANNRGAIADRLNDPSLFDDANALPHAVRIKSVLRALHRVQDQLLVQQFSVDLPPRFASQRPSAVVSPIDLASSPEEPQQVDVSRQGPSGLSLGREEWLGDEHILADFTLLQHELERDNPILAGRTRFVDPLIAHQLREGAHNDMRGALQRVLYDRYGNDTAEFLFLPVNDASGTNRGTHWSLLLVDRRDRQRPVAYHYDSLGGHNDYVAAMLATRLNASQYAASIGQQRNGYDCGVFVVDGTRELVRRLAEEWQPNLRNLDNVVADRGGLQQRLSAAPGNARATDPAYQAGPSTRSVDSTEFWRGVDQAGQPAADSWNTANFGSSQQLPATPATPSVGAWNWLGEQIHGPASPEPAPHWAAQAHPPLELPATPASPSQGAWAWLAQQMQDPASPTSVRPRSSNIYAGLDSFVDLDLPTPHDLRDDACSAPASEFAAASSFAGPPGATPELRDIGAIVGADWRHGSQAASDVLIDVLGNIHLLPNQFGPSQFTINGEHYSATFGSQGRMDVRLIHHPGAGGMKWTPDFGPAA